MNDAHRRHLAAAVTLGAALASLASLDEATPVKTYSSSPTASQTTVLTAAMPSAVRATHVAVEGTGASQITVSVQGTARWSGPSEAASAADASYGNLSAVRATLGPHGVSSVATLAAPTQSPGGALAISGPVPCDAQAARCVIDLDFALGLLDTPPGAEVTVSWTASASVEEVLGSSSPSSITITLGP
jgi:hypothetical protein